MKKKIDIKDEIIWMLKLNIILPLCLWGGFEWYTFQYNTLYFHQKKERKKQRL